MGKYGATGPLGADNSAALTGLFYGGGMTLLKAQCIGSAIITLSTFGVSMVLMYAVHAMGLLRVSKEGELYGLDLHEAWHFGLSGIRDHVAWFPGRAVIRRLMKPAAGMEAVASIPAVRPTPLKDNQVQYTTMLIDRRQHDQDRGDHQAEPI